MDDNQDQNNNSTPKTDEIAETPGIQDSKQPLEVTEKKQTSKISHDDVQLQLFTSAYIKHGSATQAYLELHPDVTYESAKTLGSRLFAKVDFATLMEEMGITDKALIQMSAKGMTSPTKFVVVEDNGKDGSILKEVPDWDVRHKFYQTALKLKKRLEKDTSTVNNQTNIGNVNFVFSDPTTPIVEVDGKDDSED